MTEIDYYLYGGSPFTYFGHRALIEMAHRHDAAIRYKPVDVRAIWAVSGGVPPAQRPPVRQRYRLIELQRVSEFRNLPINIQPRFFPVDTSLADRATIAIIEAGGNPADYIERVCAGVWTEDADLADRTEIAKRLTASGFDAETLLARAESEEIGAIRAKNSQDAIASDAVGVPSYVLNGEVFWGQDRLDMLEYALQTGRAPFSAEPGT